MEPKLTTPNFGPEQSPGLRNSGSETGLERITPEISPERRAEQGFERVEASPGADINASPVLPTPVISTPSVSTDTDAASVSPVSSNPLVANDDDLIEKEWVEKAKKIILETKDDPYRREQEVGSLQADYLRKRYGKELGNPQ